MYTEINDILKLDISSMTLKELSTWVSYKGEPSYRAKQIFEWVHKKKVDTPDKMTNIPKPLIEAVKEQKMYGVEEVTHLVSKYDGTNK